MARGLFVTFEGPEGSGKSTQVQLLTAALDQRTIRYVNTREPGGTPTADALRSILLSRETRDLGSPAELLLLQAARADHVHHVIAPGIERGHVVICDRFTDSSVAYQGGGRGLDRAFIQALNDFATGGIRPDLTFVFDIDVEEGLFRAGRQGSLELDRVESAGLEFHRRVRAAYLELVETDPSRYHCIDATRPIDDIAAEVLTTILARIDDLESGATIP